MKKTSQINLMVTPEIKKKLLEKSKVLNLSLTGYVEKIANEPIIFLDKNLKLFSDTLKIEIRHNK